MAQNKESLSSWVEGRTQEAVQRSSIAAGFKGRNKNFQGGQWGKDVPDNRLILTL